ncbi:MAG: alkaline phosphatase D family protein [Geodermatophilaceae bacterium]
MLTRSLNGGAFELQIRMGTQIAGSGFSGFLVGTGEAGTDYRRAALVGAASGTAGGLLCVYGSDGRVRFREHTDDLRQFDYAEIPSTGSGSAPVRTKTEQVEFSLNGVPDPGGTFTLTLKAVNANTQSVLSQAVLTGRSPASVAGGFALVSSGPTGTYWFRDLRTSGVGVESHPERGLGPIVGTLFSVANGTLKMTAQVIPMLLQAGDSVNLELSDGADGWVTRTSAPVGPGFAAALRTEWDFTTAQPYRVRHSRGGTFEGTIPAEPGGAGMTVASLSCTKAAHRAIDEASRYTAVVPGEQPLGLYTSKSVYFPYELLIRGIKAQAPDVLVAMGDQYYETSPTRKDASTAPELDFLYKYLLWLWSFRDITRNIPCLVLVDDHDVFQGSLYGEGGKALPPGSQPIKGGYANAPQWINIVQRVQCGHNPDPVDPDPVLQGISVYFTRFSYGGVRFALLEDRKFKTGGDKIDDLGNVIPEADLHLLGARQEAMLAEMADEGSGPPTVVVSQTMFCSLQTDPSGRRKGSRDTAGWPPLARTRATKAMAAAGAVMLSGDTHLPSLVRHIGGPVQFCGPAGGTTFTRWFEPSPPLPNPGPTPYTGDFTDSYGNAVRVLAVANVHVDQATWLNAYGEPHIGDQALKEEGYGLLRIDPVNRTHTFEAWRFDVDPAAPGATPMLGWPYVLSFDDV